MTLKEALDRLREDPGCSERGECWEVVRLGLQRLCARITRDEALQEAAVDAVRTKIGEQIRDNDLEEIDAPDAYLSIALRRRVIDAVRRRDRQQKALNREKASGKLEPTDIAPPGPEVLDVVELLDKLVKRVIERRDAWQRDHSVDAWRQVRRLHEENITLRALLIEEGIDPDDSEALRLASQRAYKAHERLRIDMDAAIPSFSRSEQLDAETVQLIRSSIQRLKRRQTRPRSGVSPAGDRK